jgi:alkanesulfonate monooxygenase SsuD/methylene tetrahydromethanopterin reductase-like flavin-dependent oxidoreductase (luciferase family)
MIVDIQFNQGHYTWPELRDAARAAEDAGYSTLWISDHLAGSVMAAPYMPECFTLLGALAEATSTIGLGVLVANVGTRHPAVLANAAATVQNISGGRFMLGLGAGASPSSPFASELHTIDMPIPTTMAERHARLEHTLDVLDEMWDANRGQKFATFPMPCVRPKIVLGVNSVALATIAGRRADGVNVRASHPHRREILAAAQPNDERPFITSVWEFLDVSKPLDETHDSQRLEREGVDRLILLARGFVTSDRLRDIRF